MTFVDWPILGLVLGLAGVAVGIGVTTWRRQQRQRALERERLAEEQTAANARALRTLTDDARRRTKREETP